MGYYIETKQPLRKADQLLSIVGVKEVPAIAASPDRSGQTVSVCVVQNGPFDAAAVCYNDSEYKCFLQPDGRPKRWLVFPREIVLAMCPSVASRLVPLDPTKSI